MSILALEYPFTHKLRISADLWMEIDAGTKTLHERDSPALAVRYSTRTRTPPERGENRTDEDPNHGGQQRGVISDPVAECVGRRQHPLADGYIGNDAVYQMGCRIRHSPASTRRAYASGLAGEGQNAV